MNCGNQVAENGRGKKKKELWQPSCLNLGEEFKKKLWQLICDDGIAKMEGKKFVVDLWHFI